MNKKLDQTGAVALITVVIFATIITVLITAYLRSAVSQQKESITYDFSNRAFYAAESGVQDTIREIRTNPALLTDKTICTPRSALANFEAANFGLSYNCQLITLTPEALTGTVEPNRQSAMIRLEPVNPVVTNPRLVLRWSSQLPIGSTDPVLYPRQDQTKLFKPTSKWWWDGQPTKIIHPPLRVSVFDHPISGNFTRVKINQRQVILNPTPAGPVYPAVDFTRLNNTVPAPVQTQQEELINNAECYDSNVTPSPAANMASYSCKQTIDISNGYSFSSSAIYARVGSIYGATNFSLELLSDGTPVPLKNSQVLIDITAKAGDNTYRRLQQAVPVTNFQLQNGPNAALLAGEGICKQLVLGTDTSVFNSNPGCNPLTF